MQKKNVLILVAILILFSGVSAQERPFIWVQKNDQKDIIQKIEEKEWAKNIYNHFITQLDKEIEWHQRDPAKFLKQMPFDWNQSKSNQIPPFLLTCHIENGVRKNLDNATHEEWATAQKLIDYLQTGIDCGIAYFITEEEKYAQCAVDILYSFTIAVRQSELSEWRGRGGWLFPDDGFREVRVIGYKVPIIYDFVASFIGDGGKAFDFAKNTRLDFPVTELQSVFRTYANITVNYGHAGSNHSVLEAPSLVYNALAMDNLKEREKWLSYFLTENTENQDALNVMAANFKNGGDIWPETSQYLNAAASIISRLMCIVNRYDPSLALGEKYQNVLYALPILGYLVYPNGEIIRWGDGKRKGRPPYQSYEDAYMLGKMDGVKKLTDKFGALLAEAFENGKYSRKGILSVLWYNDLYMNEKDSVVLTRTEQVPHAGIFLQRNLSSTGKAEDGLMCFVGGAHMVHGHAEGMNIELYGCGQVLGVDNGRGRYQQDIHENYSRIYAAHNTIIVNGNSQGSGGWVNLGINTVQLKTMEPMPRQEAISPNYSFSITGFVDDKGDKAEAVQERTLALIRTSETTGYYVDVFRSKSELPNEYHDYLYHNIGDHFQFLNEDITLQPEPERYMENANLPWEQNKTYRNPGWHFFKDVESDKAYSKDVRLRFEANKFELPIFMDLYIPGCENREYTKVSAPPTFESPQPYTGKPTPTLVIRKKGEAWNDPFVVVFEPFDGTESGHSILSVEKITVNSEYKGVKVVSQTDKQKLFQYILTQNQNEQCDYQNFGISFTGSFAIVTTDESGQALDLYMGEGTSLRFKNLSITSNLSTSNAYLNLRGKEPSFHSNNKENTRYSILQNP